MTAIGAPTAGASLGMFSRMIPQTGGALVQVLLDWDLVCAGLGNRRATRDIKRIRDMIAMRDNPLYQERVAAAGMKPLAGPFRVPPRCAMQRH